MIPMSFKNNSKFFNGLLWKYISTFKSFKSKNIILALILMVLNSLTEGISLLLLVPLLQIVGLNVQQGSLGEIANYISSFFSYFGITPTLTIILIIYVFIISFNAFIYKLQTVESFKIEYTFAANLRKHLFESITDSDWIFFIQKRSSDFAHALTNEVERISIGTGQFLTFLASIMILIVYIIFALELAGMITGIIFVVGVIILLMLRRKAGKSHYRGEEITTTTRNLYSSIMQHLEGMKTIKSFGMEEENINVFSKQSNQLANNYIDSVKSYADVKLLFDIGTVIVLSVMVLFLIDVVKLPIASLFLLIYLFVRMIPQFSTIQRSYQYFINMLPAFDNLMQVEKECLENTDSFGDRNCNVELNEFIKLENISFSYSGKGNLLFKDLKLNIPVGKTMAIVGQSGAGKSTIADLIMGLIEPTKGKITVDGMSIAECNNSWRSHIGYVPQESFLFNETIRFNLLLSKPKADETDINEALKLASAYEFVNRLPDGIDTLIGDRGVKLSGGERQRLALARALLRNPDLLILDEATSNLDSGNEIKILKAIDELHGELTILIIAHRLSTIKNADYIYLIDQGKIIENGSWDELLNIKNGKFKNLCKTQKILK